MFPLFFLIFEILITKTQNFKNKSINISAFIFYLTVFIFFNFSIYESSTLNSLNRNRVELDTEVDASSFLFQQSIEDNFKLEDTDCLEWKGTGIYSGCLSTLSINVSEYEFQVTNILSHKNELYYIFKEGLIYKQRNINSDLELFWMFQTEFSQNFLAFLKEFIV